MQNAETVLDVIGKRSARGPPIERLHRRLFNPQLYLVAYRKLYASAGAMIPEVTRETVGGMALVKIRKIIETVRLMAKRRRKTLVLGRRCHEDIHAGRATTPTRK